LYDVLCSSGAVEIGELPNLDHGIQGTLAAKDETTLFIENFHYDGQAPGLHPSNLAMHAWWFI